MRRGNPYLPIQPYVSSVDMTKWEEDVQFSRLETDTLRLARVFGDRVFELFDFAPIKESDYVSILSAFGEA